MIFETGRTVLRRYWRAGMISYLCMTTVVADDERGLRIWQPGGVPYWRLRTPDGRTHHDGPIDKLGPISLTRETWFNSIMPFFPADGPPWSVWWFFDQDTGAFTGWYVNLEDPMRRWDDGVVAGVDTADHALDIWVEPDRTWRWKDEDEFAELTGNPLYWDAAGAAEIRAAGEEVVALIEAGKFPFDGTWCDFRPDPAWSTPADRPAGWDRPRA